jgi:hypothetical protein
MKHVSDVPKVALALLALALPALAQKPTIQIVPFTSFFIPAEGGCGFDVLFTPEPGRPNKERLIQFTNMAIIAGPLFVTITNLSTGKTINLNISGPGKAEPSFSVYPHNSVSGGPEIPGPLPPEVAAAAGLPLVPIFYGRAQFTLDAQGNTTAVSFTGKVEDLCQLLQ